MHILQIKLVTFSLRRDFSRNNFASSLEPLGDLNCRSSRTQKRVCTSEHRGKLTKQASVGTALLPKIVPILLLHYFLADSQRNSITDAASL